MWVYELGSLWANCRFVNWWIIVTKRSLFICQIPFILHAALHKIINKYFMACALHKIVVINFRISPSFFFVERRDHKPSLSLADHISRHFDAEDWLSVSPELCFWISPKSESSRACTRGIHLAGSLLPVSYTHLDVYKRQLFHCATKIK